MDNVFPGFLFLSDICMFDEDIEERINLSNVYNANVFLTSAHGCLTLNGISRA